MRPANSVYCIFFLQLNTITTTNWLSFCLGVCNLLIELFFSEVLFVIILNFL